MSLIGFAHFLKIFFILCKVLQEILSYIPNFHILFKFLSENNITHTNCSQLQIIFPTESCHQLETYLPSKYCNNVNSQCIYALWQYHIYATCGLFVLYIWQIYGHFLHVQDNIYSNSWSFNYILSFLLDVAYVHLDTIFIPYANLFFVYPLLIREPDTSLYVTNYEIKIKFYSYVTKQLGVFILMDTFFYKIIYFFKNLNIFFLIYLTPRRCIRGNFINVYSLSIYTSLYFYMKDMYISIDLIYLALKYFIRNCSVLDVDSNDVQFSNKSVFQIDFEINNIYSKFITSS